MTPPVVPATRVAEGTGCTSRADDPKSLFLKGLRRDSGRKIAALIFDDLVGSTEGGPLNLSAIGRRAGYSRETVRLVVRTLVGWGRILPVKGYRKGSPRPGRPGGYRLHPAFVKADRICVGAKRATPPYTYPLTPTSKACHTVHLSADPSNPKTSDYDQKRTSTPRANSNANQDELLDPLRARRLVLGRLREHLRGYPGLSPVAVDRIQNGVGAALARRWPANGGAIHRWEADLVFSCVRRYLDEDEGFSLSDRKSYACGALAVRLAAEALESARRVRNWARGRPPASPTAPDRAPTPVAAPQPVLQPAPTPTMPPLPRKPEPDSVFGGDAMRKRVLDSPASVPSTRVPVPNRTPPLDDELPLDPKARLEAMARVKAEWEDPSAVEQALEAMRRVFPSFGMKKTRPRTGMVDYGDSGSDLGSDETDDLD